MPPSGGMPGGLSNRTLQRKHKVGYRTVAAALESAVATFAQSIVSGGLAALGGWAAVGINHDGSLRWYGHAHDSGADGYDFGVAFIVRSSTGTALSFAHRGSVSGTLSLSGERDHDWDETLPPHPLVTSRLGDFLQARADMSVEYSSDIGSTLEAAVGWTIKWVVGASPVGSAFGVIVFAGLTVGSIISEGSGPGCCPSSGEHSLDGRAVQHPVGDRSRRNRVGR